MRVASHAFSEVCDGDLVVSLLPVCSLLPSVDGQRTDMLLLLGVLLGTTSTCGPRRSCGTSLWIKQVP